MTIDQYKDELRLAKSETDRVEFIQRNYFNGTPYIFKDRDSDYYRFTKRIADNFEISYKEVLN
jgi:hypothetical protein